MILEKSGFLDWTPIKTSRTKVCVEACKCVWAYKARHKMNWGNHGGAVSVCMCGMLCVFLWKCVRWLKQCSPRVHVHWHHISINKAVPGTKPYFLFVFTCSCSLGVHVCACEFSFKIYIIDCMCILVSLCLQWMYTVYSQYKSL